MQQLRPNTTLQGGKYRIDRMLGQGGFGYFSIGCKTSGALTKEEWTIQDNLKAFRVNFLPTSKRTNGKVTSKTFISGLKATVIDLAEKKKKDEEGD